jgi:hypothetical protein
MPLQKLQFRPGVNREGTSLSNEGGWYDGDKIRFRSGYPEKIGGWAALSFNTFLGVCRSLWNWITLTSYNLVGVGTNLKFYIENGGAYYDITPIRATTVDTTTFAAGYSTLDDDITNSDTTIVLVDATNFVANDGHILIGTEEITYLSKSGNQLLNCTRGANGTTPASHLAGDGVGSSMLTITDSTASNIQVNDFITFYGATSLSVASNQSYTVNPTTDVFTVSSALPNGTTIQVTTTGTVPAGMAVDTTYYVINSSSLTFKLALTAGGAAIDVTDAGTGTQSLVVTSGMTAAVLNQEYQIVTALTGGTGYIIEARAAVTNPVVNVATTNGGATVFATSLDVGNGGGGVDTAYQISTGLSLYTVGTGWGTGPWGRDAWGSGYTTGIGLQLRLWNQINFGEYLLFSPRGGALYLWQPGPGATPAFTSRGELVSGKDVPSQINNLTVSDASRIVIAFGCNDIGIYNSTPLEPMLVRWTAQESYTDWTPTAVNQAGSFRLSHGSIIIGTLQTRQEILIWTDAAIYSMQYVGPPYVWGFTLLSDNISVVSQNAMITAGGVTYWMGTDKFYTYSGRVETLPCSVRQYIFDDINRDQYAQYFACTNEGYSEVWWFYCSTNSDEIDKYVIYNYLDKVWYYGTLSRTAWLDSPLRPYPMAATPSHRLVFHEFGNDNAETDQPTPITSYIESSDFDIGDGQNYAFVWRMLPDIGFDGSTTPLPNKPSVTLTMRPKQNPGAPFGPAPSPTVQAANLYNVQHTYNVQEFTQIVYTRIRGREMAFRIESTGIGTAWQLGVPSMDIRQDGRR